MAKSYRVFIVMFLLAAAAVCHAQSDSGRAYFDSGVFALEEGDVKAAETNFLKALDLNPKNALYHYYLGKTYLKTAQYEKAAAPLDTARRIDPDISGLSYDIAYLNFKLEKYAEAARQFEAVIKEDPKNVLAHYYCGISLYNLKQYREALGYFVAASDMSPTIKANGFYYAGICSMRLGELTQAVERLEYVKDHADSEMLRGHAVKWLGAIEKQKQKLKPYSLYVKLGYQYDSNVTLDPLNQDLVSNEDDFATVGYFSGSYNVINRSDFILGAGYNHYQSWHNQLEQYDLIGSTGNFYAKYSLGPVTLSLNYFPQYYWMDKESYLRRHQFMPALTWWITRDLATRFSYSYYDNDYFQDDGRDGHTDEPALNLYYFFANQKGFLFAGGAYEDHTTVSPDREYNQARGWAGLSVTLPWKLTLTATGLYYAKNYANKDSVFGIRREDDRLDGTFSLSRTLFFNWLSLVVDYSFTKNNSNIDVYEYRRHMTTLSLSAKF